MARTRTVSTKISVEEFQKLEDLAQRSEISVSELCRQALLSQVNQGDSSPTENAVLLAEVLGLRTIVLNLLYSLGRGEKLTTEKMQALIDRADREKLDTALQRLGKEPAKKKAGAK
jgi:hypothetical protein